MHMGADDDGREPAEACGVCTERFGGDRKRTACAYCGYGVCSACVGTYILSRAAAPSCMSCRRAFLEDHLEAMLPAAFLRRQLRDHLAGVALDAERARLPEAQPYARLVAAADAERERLEAERIPPLAAEHAAAVEALEDARRDLAREGPSAGREANLVFRSVAEKRARRALTRASAGPAALRMAVKNALWAMRRSERPEMRHFFPKGVDLPFPAVPRGTRLIFRENWAADSDDDVDEGDDEGDREVVEGGAARGGGGPSRPEILGPCPRGACRGFVASDGACGTCAGRTCVDCMLPVEAAAGPTTPGGAHRCDAASLASTRAIRADSRACPKCYAFIHRISGCDQMWCTRCNTAFDWRTGEVETGVVHNPHAFEFFRLHPEMAGRGPAGACGEDPLRRLFERADELGIPAEAVDKLAAAGRFARHVEAVTLRALRRVRVSNLDLRVRFLLGRIDEAEFRSCLAARAKDARKRRAIEDYYQLLPTAIFSIIGEVAEGRIRPNGIRASLSRFANLANRIARGIAKRYGTTMRPPRISTVPRFEWKPYRYESRAWPLGK